MKALVDPHGRRIRKLRLSLTDRCNLRCHYCMPVDTTFMSDKRYLSFAETYDIVRELCIHGLEELRLTGGEPLMRRGFTELTEKLSQLPLKKIGMTTNAVLLDQSLGDLKRHRVDHLNISLDSLHAETFRKITHGNHLERVLQNIKAAKDQGFQVKINTVVMRGVNDHELFDFVEFSRAMDMEVRFLEIMRIGYACKDQSQQFIKAQELIDRLKTRYQLQPVWREGDSTSFNFRLDGGAPKGAQVGFIASESQAFCGQCSRWRLSADGVMRACLLKDDGVSMKGKSSEQRQDLYQTLLGMKPFRRPLEVTHLMNTIGG